MRLTLSTATLLTGGAIALTAAMPAAAQMTSPQSRLHVSSGQSRVTTSGQMNTSGQWRGGQWQGGNGQYRGNGGHWRGGTWHGGNWNRGNRWGGRVQGHWWGGMSAPGGWAAYHRPYRGWRVPNYWVSPNWYISDWATYGLPQPPYGYNWSRYYDDAVLIDSSGQVYDTQGDVDWGRYDGGYDDGAYYDQRYDSSHDVPVGPGAGYPVPAGTTAPPVVHNYTCAGACGNLRSGSYASGGYVSGGYYYPPATTTTVTVTSQPVVTTTTTEYVDDCNCRTTYHVRRPVKHVWHTPSKIVPRGKVTRRYHKK